MRGGQIQNCGIWLTEVLNYVCIQIFIITDNKVHPCPVTGIILEVFWMYGVIRREETQDNWLNTVEQSKSSTLCSTISSYEIMLHALIDNIHSHAMV